MSENTQFETHVYDADAGLTNKIELDKPFACNFCHERFGTQDNLTLHLEIHSIKKSFPCIICKKTFQTKIRLENHHKKQHVAQEANKTVLTIPSPTRSIMSKLIPTKTAKTSRQTSRLSYSRVSYPCDECGKTFASKAMLIVHFRIHTKEQPFECELCHKRFSQIGNLKTHLFIHTDEKPFKCDLCDRRFIQKGNLQSHYKTHTNEKPFGCSACHKRFTQKGNLVAHERSHHFTDKPYKCSMCHKTFATQLYYKKHMEIHGINPNKSSPIEPPPTMVPIPSYGITVPPVSTTKNYKCTVCGDVFDRKRDLNLHYRVHGDVMSKLIGQSTVSGYDKSVMDDIAEDLLAIKAADFRRNSQSSEVSNPLSASKESSMGCSEDSDNNSSQNRQESDDSSDAPKFTQKSSLATFIDKRFKCDLCPKEFSLKHDLVEHSKIHKGDKPFQCDQCPLRFSQNKSLEFHCKSVHGGRKLDIALENINKNLSPIASYKPLKQKLVLRKQASHSWEVLNTDENSSDES